MPKTHPNAHVLARELDAAFIKAGRTRGDVARIVGVSDETIRRWLLGAIPLLPDARRLHGFDKAANWAKGECRRILNDGVAAAPPADFLEVFTEALQAHLAAVEEGQKITGEKITGEESREQLALIIERAYTAAISERRRQNIVPPSRPRYNNIDDEAPQADHRFRGLPIF